MVETRFRAQQRQSEVDNVKCMREIQVIIGKIDELLAQSGFNIYVGSFSDFISPFQQTGLDRLLDFASGELHCLTFVKQFCGILYDLGCALQAGRVSYNLVPEQQVPLWMCCVLYLTIVGTEEYNTDVDNNFYDYFGEYLVERIVGRTRRGPASLARLVASVFNKELCALLTADIMPKSKHF